MNPAATNPERPGLETVTLGGGCFWCLEAVFDQMEGVRSVVSGYSGGKAPDPSYKEVCSGTTGHAEVVQIVFDPKVLPLADLLRIFFTLHDPTTPNRQGADVGTQYRSIVLVADAGQKATTEAVRKEIADAGIWDAAIVTEIVAFEKFWPAEASHQEYFARNPEQGYCRAVIAPKVAKARQLFRERLKESSAAPR